MNEEDGMFTDRGYIVYKGYYSMEEVTNGGQSSRNFMLIPEACKLVLEAG